MRLVVPDKYCSLSTIVKSGRRRLSISPVFLRSLLLRCISWTILFHGMPPGLRLYAPTGWPGSTPPDNLPLENLPITSPYCVTPACKAFRDGYAADELKTPLLGLLDYSYWTVAFYTVWLLLFTSIHISHLLHDPHPLPRKPRPSTTDRLTARLRFYTYRRPTNHLSRALGLQQTSYGTLALFALGMLFILILPWPAHRLLRVRFRFGSPPLSVRCAMMISALTPLTVALAGKVNVVTACTGIGYERLNVWHRGVAWAVFGLGTAHTVPHLIAPVRDGGWSMLDKLYANRARELSGTALYGVVFGLTVASLPGVRRRFYEAFKYCHVFLGVAYVSVFFWHAHGNLCPGYIYATLAILVVSNLIRLFQRHRNLRSFATLAGFPTTVKHLPGLTTRVAIQVPRSFTWKPGQHVFLRIPRLALLQNHPFSIANIPISEGCGDGAVQEMVFLVRRRGGFTKKLGDEHESGEGNLDSPPCSGDSGVSTSSASDLEKPCLSIEDKSNTITMEELESTPNLTTPTPHLITNNPPPTPLRTIIDGSHGTHHRPYHTIYDTILCIAGGTGITACLPHILDLARRAPTCRTRTLHLIWLVRDVAWLSWIERDLSAAMRDVRGSACTLAVDVYVTRTAERLCASPLVVEAGPISPLSPMGEVVFGRVGDGRGLSLPLPERPRPVLRRHGGEADVFASAGREEKDGGVKVHYCRPVVRHVVERCVGGERAVVIACGPPSLSAEVANTVAALQKRVLSGAMSELGLEVEVFGW
ncbi:hypothetical protein P153DRAFT_430222 [Dothidotthia symphoricarpi CBS 119687]|uniref:ferric-chelate reductase (NADPH) n=1 Tax=Dothidotthia symphoricarpi CBS 119687 TaxID=1392245 RepID=A0A6A6AG40_9PLEO|nr:uncharacterized protein P153DRAFT_430222 [Dothidotthia symphoricarpi CBS 119687]KAF2130942.1 hypothetical protein P153DRAFT_430222 [Dothidotthia symphoricarpi CBS 119687]